jgi:hypothetical protein
LKRGKKSWTRKAENPNKRKRASVRLFLRSVHLSRIESQLPVIQRVTLSLYWPRYPSSKAENSERNEKRERETKRRVRQRERERQREVWFTLCDATLLIPKFLTYSNFNPVQSTSPLPFSTHGHIKVRRDAKHQSDPANAKTVNTLSLYLLFNRYLFVRYSKMSY